LLDFWSLRLSYASSSAASMSSIVLFNALAGLFARSWQLVAEMDLRREDLSKVPAGGQACGGGPQDLATMDERMDGPAAAWRQSSGSAQPALSIRLGTL